MLQLKLNCQYYFCTFLAPVPNVRTGRRLPKNVHFRVFICFRIRTVLPYSDETMFSYRQKATKTNSYIKKERILHLNGQFNDVQACLLQAAIEIQTFIQNSNFSEFTGIMFEINHFVVLNERKYLLTKKNHFGKPSQIN